MSFLCYEDATISDLSFETFSVSMKIKLKDLLLIKTLNSKGIFHIKIRTELKQ